MDVLALKEHLIENEELIELVLESCGFGNINGDFANGSEYRCGWDDESNPTSIRVYKDTLQSSYFKTGLEGDLITLVQSKMNYSFPKTLKFISDVINFKAEDVMIYENAFGGLFLELEQIADSGEYIEMNIHNESELDNFLIMPSVRFLNDGIDYQTQVDFKIGYDVGTNRIIIPWRNLNGDLIGIMGRLNKNECEDWESKWLPINGFNFPKSKTLFAYHENCEYIREQSMVMLFESEKSPLKLRSQGCNLALGLGGNKVSTYQADSINSLLPELIILGLDEGLSEEHSIEVAKKLKLDSYYKNKVCYLYDEEGKYLPKGSKMSPADLPLEELKKMIKECAFEV